MSGTVLLPFDADGTEVEEVALAKTSELTTFQVAVDGSERLSAIRPGCRPTGTGPDDDRLRSDVSARDSVCDTSPSGLALPSFSRAE